MDTDDEFASEKSYFEDDALSSQIGVSEFLITKQPILKSQIPKKRTSFDRLIIKNLINIQIDNGPYKVLSLEEYQQKLTGNLSIAFSSDQIKNWLTIIGLKWTEESKGLEENTETQSSIEGFTLKCSAEVQTKEDTEFLENGNEEEEGEEEEEEGEGGEEEEDLSSTLEDDEMTNEEIIPSTKNSKLGIPEIEMEEERQNINVQLEMEGNNEMHIKTELPDIEDEVQADIVNIEEFNQTINTVTNCLDDQDLSEGEKTEDTEKITTEIEIDCGNKGVVTYHYSVIREKTPPNHRILPTFYYFYRKMKKTRYKCTIGTLLKWLQLLNINVKPHNYHSNVKKKEDRLSFNIIELLIQFEKEFYENKKPLPKHRTINYNYKLFTKKITEDTDKEKVTEEIPEGTKHSKLIETNSELIPTLDYFYHCLKETNNVCCKSWLKKWLQFLNIKFESTICVLGKKCDTTEQQPSPSVIKLLIEFEETFHYPNKTIPGVLVRMLENIDDKYKKNDEIPSIDFIYDYVFTSKEFARRTPYSKTRLMDWLIVLKINFRNKTQLNVFDKKLDETSGLFCDADALPSLEYFFKKVNACSKNTLMKWLEVLNIKYELKDRNLDTNWNPDPPLSSVITNLLINLEDDFYKSKETSLTLPRFLIDLETQFKKESIKIPSLNEYQQKVIESKLFKSSQACCKHNLKSLLMKLNINFTLGTSFNVSPTLSYFHEKLQKICDFSLSELNAWLNEVGISFENDLKNLVIENVEIKPISNELRQLLCNIDHEYRLKDLIAHLKNVEKDFDKHRKCLTFENIYEIIKMTNLFDTNVDTDYKKLALKKWVRKLGIKFGDIKEEEPSLDYFHEKIKLIEKVTYSKDQLAKWLNQVGVKFKENHLITDNMDGPHAPPNIIPTLWQISKYHCLWDVEPIFKKIQYKFISRGQVPSIDYLEKVLFDLKGKHYCSKVMLKSWLTFLGITFSGPIRNEHQRSQREAIEKDIDSVLKKKSKINTRLYEETQTDVIEIDDDDDDDWEYDDKSMDSNIERVEFPQQTEVIEMEDDDAEDMLTKKKYKSSLLKTESPRITAEPSSSLIFHSYDNVNGDDERVEFAQQTELIEMEDVILYPYENTSAPDHINKIIKFPQQTEDTVLETPSTSQEPNSSKHQFVSERTDTPKIITEPSSSLIFHSYDNVNGDYERVEFPQQTELIEMEGVILYPYENTSAPDHINKIVEFPQQTEDIVVETPSTSQELNSSKHVSERTDPQKIITEPASSVISSTPDRVNDDETVVFPHQTEVIEMAEVNLYCYENPSGIDNVVDDDGDDPQQTEVIEILDDDPEDIPKKTKCKSSSTGPSKKRNSSKKPKSKKNKSAKMIKEPSSSIILPDYLWNLLTDIEDNYFRMKQIPTLEHFYLVMVRNFGNIYSKDVLRGCLTKAGIMFTSNSDDNDPKRVVVN